MAHPGAMQDPLGHPLCAPGRVSEPFSVYQQTVERGDGRASSKRRDAP